MRDAARELADGLHLLRLAQLLLEHAPLGDVAQDEQVPVGHELRRRPDLEHEPAPVLLSVPDVLLHALGDPSGLQEHVPIGLRALGADEIVQSAAEQLVAPTPVEPARRLVDPHEVALGVEHGDDVHRRVENGLEVCLHPAERAG